MRQIKKLFAASLALLLMVNAAHASEAGRRVALVIGNSAYQDAKLRNPANDAEDIASALRKVGFEVIARRDADQKQMKAAVREFGQKLRGAETGLFYFAGHGIQVKNINYIVPVGVDIQSEADTEDQAVSLDYVMRTLEEGGARFNIAILDACRNNPFARSFRSASRGLAVTQASGGMLIAYATSPGSVAADGSGRNGVYTKHLLKSLNEGDSDIQKVFQRVRTGVVAETGGKQTPWETTSLTGDFYFKPGSGTQVASLEPVPIPTQPGVHVKSRAEIEQETWDSARNSGNVGAIQEYLKQYPKGVFVGQAKVLLATLKTTAEPAIVPVREDGETALWNEVQKSGTNEDYRAYLGQYPKGKFTALAKTRLKKLDAETAQQAKNERETAAQNSKQQEQPIWQTAQSSEDEKALQGYLNQYPGGSHAAEAKQKLARLQSAKPQTDSLSANCVFPNSNAAAPGWVCDEPVAGYELTTVGSAPIASKNPKAKLPSFQSALLDAVVQLSQQMKVQVQNMIKQSAETAGAAKSEAVNLVTTSVTKQTASIKIGKNIAISNMVKQYVETTGKGKDETVDRVNSSVSKLEMASPCAYTMQSFIETTGAGESETVDATSDETGKQCTVEDVIKQLSSAGIHVVYTVKSPMGDQFLLLGAKKISQLKITLK